MFAVPLLAFLAEFLLVSGLLTLITLQWPDNFFSRGLVLIRG